MGYKSEIREITYNSRTIEYNLTRKPVKNINLRIKSEGIVLVSANNRVPVSYIDDFIKAKWEFISTALDYYKEQRSKISEPKQYVSGEYFKFLGKDFPLEVVEGKVEGVKFDNYNIYLFVKEKSNFHRKEKLMNDWKKEQQKIIFHEICQATYPIVENYGVAYPIIRARLMTSRWGSCIPQKGSITLNSRLIKAPVECIEYVVLHEFAHLIHPNHSRKFYDFIASYMPDWKERKNKLESTFH